VRQFHFGNNELASFHAARNPLRSHLSRTTDSLTWGIHNSSLRLLHDNSANTTL